MKIKKILPSVIQKTGRTVNWEGTYIIAFRCVMKSNRLEDYRESRIA